MTIEEIRNSDKAFLTVSDIAPVIGVRATDLRETARRCPERLGFPVTCPTEHTVKFPRKPFLAFLGEEEKPATDGELQQVNNRE